MKTINVLGIDLAKSIFQLHGNDSFGRTVFQRRIKRAKLKEFIAQLPPCLIGMEACSGASFWAIEFERCGHTVKLIAPQFVKPYVKTNKNDQADAEAIAEAVSRPNMRFVPIKQVWQRDIQAIHRVRTRLVRSRVALTNEIHGLLSEYGIVIARSARSEERFRFELSSVISPESEALSKSAKETFHELLDEFRMIQTRIDRLEDRLLEISKSNDLCRRLQTIPGIGTITATAVLSAVADPSLFKNGRQFSAWLGLVPRQSSSGGKELLLGISKRGDVYLRCLLIHGARSVLRTAPRGKTDRLSLWALRKQETRGANRAIVAVANKNARTIWALMSSGKEYQAQQAQAA